MGLWGLGAEPPGARFEPTGRGRFGRSGARRVLAGASPLATEPGRLGGGIRGARAACESCGAAAAAETRPRPNGNVCRSRRRSPVSAEGRAGQPRAGSPAARSRVPAPTVRLRSSRGPRAALAVFPEPRHLPPAGLRGVRLSGASGSPGPRLSRTALSCPGKWGPRDVLVPEARRASARSEPAGPVPRCRARWV